MVRHCGSPRSRVFARTSWVWREEEGSLLPPLLCHCTSAIRRGAAVVPPSSPMGAGAGQPAAVSGGYWCSQEDGAPQLHAVMLHMWPFPWLLPKLLKTLTKTSCSWRNSPNGRRIPASGTGLSIPVLCFSVRGDGSVF